MAHTPNSRIQSKTYSENRHLVFCSRFQEKTKKQRNFLTDFSQSVNFFDRPQIIGHFFDRP